ncbi:MAG: hydroxymethylglutaryl-CoA synthase [Candidatus Thermoplasmatota archaeon]|nr:hydroxymethylglutaryl-CoA synthase [Candidatus Thermoplasmatota archaeon]
MAVGISGYGIYIPRFRIKREEYAKAWGSFSAAGVTEKSVFGFDEDALTAAAKVTRRALESVPMEADMVTRFALATTSAPYLEKLLSGTVLVSVGIPNSAFTSDHTSSTRAGTEAMLAAFEHVMATQSGKAVVAAADAPKASMWDAVEHAFGAGAAAFVISSDNLIAELEGHFSYASEHFGERFKPKDDPLVRDLNVKKFAEGSVVRNTTSAGSALLKKLGRKPEDYQHVVIQQPDARVPVTVASRLKFTDAQLASSLVSKTLGDLGAASVPVALASALDAAKAGDRIMVISYGSGAGSDALSFKVVTDKKATVRVQADTERREYIDYVKYLKIKGAIQ